MQNGCLSCWSQHTTPLHKLHTLDPKALDDLVPNLELKHPSCQKRTLGAGASRRRRLSPTHHTEQQYH